MMLQLRRLKNWVSRGPEWRGALREARRQQRRWETDDPGSEKRRQPTSTLTEGDCFDYVPATRGCINEIHPLFANLRLNHMWVRRQKYWYQRCGRCWQVITEGDLYGSVVYNNCGVLSTECASKTICLRCAERFGRKHGRLRARSAVAERA